MATIKDIAQEAGVSSATVSRVINNGPKVGEATRNRVKKIMADLGYRPNANARALVTQRSASFGIVLPELSDPFFATMAHGIESVTRKKNVQILMSTGSIEKATELKAIETLLEHRCNAMVVHSKALDDATLIDFANTIPGFVLINRYIEEIGNRCVWLDNIAGGETMARYILKQGHKKLVVVSSKYQINDPVDRIAGIEQELNANGIDLSPNMIEYSTPDQEGGEVAMQNFLAKGAEFTAVLAYNDAMASGAMTMLLDHSIDIPNEVSVIGYDDVLLAKYCRPKLTTLRYPIEMMAVKATELALQYAAGIQPEPGKTFKYAPTIVKRESVSKANQ
ncbi:MULTISPECIES: substrate-binding domain-containing protein [Aliiglaciecola]|uniref:substrate-binding domain-containing protein n=1 Tax=Aliiglaciecola TaxID=1406885 RepID=UPI001C0A5718|nr:MULTISPECIES: substrate-binding domain-containing protein [Aliiglaciecola]MBU2878976.1 substrate-binding domain-containing protein [Aliiglaciecola lipolytica]MDO6710677.1 substrate-binding domain-containing protein [Aliiglaciecola sp. 2_MG-2023]MDO6751915.1 substrate-binding domain-containing protein [Aliiglaciecola sp. 1_MG-2023]